MSEPGAGAPFRLITIPFSHYCEKARWALDRAGVPYREETYPPLGHAVPALRAGGGRTVPVLVTRAGALGDSTDILRYADEFVPAEHALFFREPDPRRDDVASLEERFDRELGPATRRVVYHHLLPDEALSYTLLARSFPTPEGAAAPFWLRRGAFRAYFPAVRALMNRAMRIDAASAERSRGRIRAVFDAVNERLRDGRPFLAGDRFSAADLTFASLAAPALLPEGYPVPLPVPGDLPAALRALVEALRAEPAGAFALRLYREQRALKVGETRAA
ncbi:glutathione S-transferase [Sorangium cellulosum]|uniref:Glutathione S-transferase n=1 Tax=Sorangium cellulosum TaxID=56 RepID=A0A2L0F009_SORCE|nr:glutathione S-transferase family protein [Sorangium cellulosum]AUX44819.1 glutathione S-transferase [Sorangium cellulosum]